MALKSTTDKLIELEPESKGNKLLISDLQFEKKLLQNRIDILIKHINSPMPTIENSNHSTTTNRVNSSDKEIIEMLKQLKLQTQFLWKGIVELSSSENSVKAEIKQSTYDSILELLIFLQHIGQIDFQANEIYKMLETKEPVLEISVWNISTKIKNFTSLINSSRI